MKKNSDSLRKSPRQGRSRDLVQAIYQATVRILPEVGSSQLTTKKIAEVAGVSVGSLYQYFPNKESVLAAVLDTSSAFINASLNRRFADLPSMSLDDAIQYTVDSALDLMLTDSASIREIYRQANELGRLDAMFRFRRAAVTRLTAELVRRDPSLDPTRAERMTFVAVNSLMGVVFTKLYDEHQPWTKEELSLELGAMLKAYFR